MRAAADAAVRELGWKKPYHVDADHIRLETVDGFIASSDFYTIDVADAIGQPAEAGAVEAFRGPACRASRPAGDSRHRRRLCDPRGDVERIAGKYLLAVQEAGRIYRHIAAAKGEGRFITEVSMDETDSPQTPPELLVILAAIADEKIPLQTIAPKFTGRFNKGVDYVGDLAQFEKEFQQDLAVIAFAVRKYGLPANLKLSVHSGSDKFSIYAPIRRAIARFDAGLHIKTAGTTWLEEVIGLAEAGGEGLDPRQGDLRQGPAKARRSVRPYAAVIDIDRQQAAFRGEVEGWSAEQFVAALRHDPRCPAFNPHLRQLIHVGYKIAAQMGERYLKMLEACEPTIAKNVTENLYERHLKPLFSWQRERRLEKRE